MAHPQEESQDHAVAGNALVVGVGGAQQHTQEEGATDDRLHIDRKSPNVEEKYNLKLLLGLPFELFAEVCGHVAGRDLLKLAQVNKALRNTMLSRSARPIWSAQRINLGYALLPGTTELEFALLLYSEKCQFCDGNCCWRREEQLCLRVRCCRPCFKSCTISDKQIDTWSPYLHPAAIDCVRSSTKPEEPLESLFFETTRGGTPLMILRDTIYLRSDLLAVDQLLEKLEAKAAAVSAQDDSRANHSSNESPGTIGDDDVTIKAKDVESFVQERIAWVAAEEQASDELVENLSRLEMEF
ncbi:hypothetical protein JCM3766R1_004592 [Sporobolomyces carnicolor]